MTRVLALEALDELELSTTPCHEPCHVAGAVSRYVHAGQRPPALSVMGSVGRRTLMPAMPAQSVIHFAIGRRQVTMTGCDGQSVIS